MTPTLDDLEQYAAHLQRISRLGRLYKHYVTSPILYFAARSFGHRVIEVGCGVGSGCLGRYSDRIQGLEINPHAVDYYRAKGLQALLIPTNGLYPLADETYDAYVLDNVLEHITDPRQTLDECHRVTGPKGGLAIAVP